MAFENKAAEKLAIESNLHRADFPITEEGKLVVSKPIQG